VCPVPCFLQVFSGIPLMRNRSFPDAIPAKIIPDPGIHTGMQTIRGIPARYLTIACIVLSFLLFSAGGTAFSQSPFYGGLFIVLAIFLFIVGMHFGRQDPDNE
jgi:hypothetical protein